MSLNPSEYNLSPQLLDAMRQNDYDTIHRNFQNYDDDKNRKTIDEHFMESQEEIYHTLSEPLKKMQSQYLARSLKNCYKDKHIDDEWTNLEQIKHCKAKIRFKIFGEFEESLHNARTRDSYNFVDWLHNARYQEAKGQAWMNKFELASRITNQKIADTFRDTHAKYI